MSKVFLNYQTSSASKALIFTGKSDAGLNFNTHFNYYKTSKYIKNFCGLLKELD